ncbi:MAG: S9 family peptidase [Actinobacteria bacterium 13_2_20CM_2_71_6]|nr:MAG: S9 family peptidase [Actinobacteria bacterium 13_2_20CM_2_71_6]
MTSPAAHVDTDPYRWLEDLVGEEATAWVRARNAETLARLTGGARFTELRDEIQAVLDADERIPLPTWRGRYLYNLWKDRGHPRGLWRRTTLDEYRKREPDWDVLIDLDALADREGENWIWQDVTVRRPAGTRALVSLSRGGSDANVVREFDLDTREFVADGFALPEAKSSVGWIDRDRIYVGTDFGPGSLTAAGLPRIVKEWRRGTPLSDAATVYAGEADDVAVDAWHDPTPGYERDFVRRYLDFYRSENYLRTGGGELVRIPVPLDADVDSHRDWLLIRLRSPWTVGGEGYAAGTLLITRLDAFRAGDRDLTVVFRPDSHTSLSYHSWTRDHLILTMLSDVRSRQEIITPTPEGVRRTALPADEPGHTEVVDTNPDDSDEYLLSVSGFTLPTTLRYGRVGGTPETLKQEPAFFDTTGLSVRQFFATSADGTRVPYFVVGRELAAPGPTLLTGYGGFEISYTPGYDGVIGRGWLARGGTYAVANIRGGGEYGPEWHHAALRENRPRAYEDFAAVAADLVERGITTRAQLGAIGGSNGGLLMGVMLTQYPELFGAIVSQVPLLDMKRYHKLLAGPAWMAEYGDPDDESDWAYLSRFSPYQNVHSGRPYPPVFFVTSTRDDRVHPAHARKMVARLAEHGYDVAYYENIEGGHGAAADNRQLALKSALVLEFLWQRLVQA